MTEGGRRLALVQKFRAVARERLEKLNNAFVQLEASPEKRELVPVLLREIHTLKGEAKLMGFSATSEQAHLVEDLLVKARGADFSMASELVDAVFRGFDLLGASLEPGRPEEEVEAAVAEFARRSRAVLEDRPAPGGKPSREPAPIGDAPSAPGGEEAAAPAAASAATDASLRVDVRRIDDLSELLGELVRHHALADLAMGAVAEAVALALGASEKGAEAPATRGSGRRREARASRARLFDELRLLREELSSCRARLHEAEQAVTSLRLVPLGGLLRSYPRAIRDLAAEQGNRVAVRIEGDDLELDARVLDQVADPLVHIIRNAVGHGIELPEERRRAGKPEQGIITIAAVRAGPGVELTVQDDGRGLSLEGLKERALSLGLVDAREVAEMAAEEVARLAFLPGLSTARTATEIAGRGVGLDVVRTAVEGLGGAVRIRTSPGNGTAVVLTLPISVSLMRVLLLEVGDTKVAVPCHAIDTVVRLAPTDLVQTGAGVACRVGERLVPSGSFARVLGLPDDAEAPPESVVVVESDGRTFGFHGGSILGERELLHRPLDPFLAAMPLAIGAAVLEDGTPALVLGASELLRAARSRGTPSRPARRPRKAERRPRVLLVEDSEMTRDVLVDMVSAMGCDVLEARDGQEGLEVVRSERPDLVVTDLEMPVMDGFELIRSIRRTPAVDDLPIVVLTARGSDEDKRRASELGADAYVVKSDLAAGAFSRTIKRLLGTTKDEGG